MKNQDPVFEFLSGFRILTNTHTLYRRSDEKENALNPEYCFHSSSFCTAIKKDKALLEKCIKDCAQNVLYKAKSSKTSFIATCHANAKEIVFPLHSNGIYQGSLFIGPYKNAKGKTHKIAEIHYRRLPKFSSDYQKGVSALLSSFSPFLINESEKILLSSARELLGEAYSYDEIRLARLLYQRSV